MSTIHRPTVKLALKRQNLDLICLPDTQTVSKTLFTYQNFHLLQPCWQFSEELERQQAEAASLAHCRLLTQFPASSLTQSREQAGWSPQCRDVRRKNSSFSLLPCCAFCSPTWYHSFYLEKLLPATNLQRNFARKIILLYFQNLQDTPICSITNLGFYLQRRQTRMAIQGAKGNICHLCSLKECFSN